MYRGDELLPVAGHNATVLGLFEASVAPARLSCILTIEEWREQVNGSTVKLGIEMVLGTGWPCLRRFDSGPANLKIEYGVAAVRQSYCLMRPKGLRPAMSACSFASPT